MRTLQRPIERFAVLDLQRFFAASRHCFQRAGARKSFGNGKIEFVWYGDLFELSDFVIVLSPAPGVQRSSSITPSGVIEFSVQKLVMSLLSLILFRVVERLAPKTSMLIWTSRQSCPVTNRRA